MEIIPLEISPEMKAFIDWFTALQEWSKKEWNKLGLTKEQLGEPAPRKETKELVVNTIDN